MEIVSSEAIFANRVASQYQRNLKDLEDSNMSDVADRVKAVVTKTLKVEPSRVVDEARFVEDLGAQSVQSIELVAAFEEEFDIDIDEQAALAVKTVQDAVTFLSGIVGN